MHNDLNDIENINVKNKYSENVKKYLNLIGYSEYNKVEYPTMGDDGTPKATGSEENVEDLDEGV